MTIRILLLYILGVSLGFSLLLVRHPRKVAPVCHIDAPQSTAQELKEVGRCDDR